MNIAENIVRGAKLFPENKAIIFGSQVFSYTELDDLSNVVANGLRKLGVRRGDRVALYLPNIPAFATGYLGIQKLGAIAVSISARLKSSEAGFILNDCGANILLTTTELQEQITNHPSVKILIAQNDGTFSGFTSEKTHCLVDMERDDPAAILYTSGTTGSPKGVVLSHSNLVSNVCAFNHLCGMRPDDCLLLFLPLSHCFGQNAILNSGLSSGATIAMLQGFDPTQVSRSIVENHVTMLFGVPMSFRLLYDLTSIEQMVSLRYCFSAADKLELETSQRWQEKYGIPIHEGYGLTETSPFASYNHHLKLKLGSIGMPIDNVEMKIVDTVTGAQLSCNKPGEIVIRGPNVMLGYWNRDAATGEAIRDGWLHSGDIGSVDEQGYFSILGRIKDMVIVGGSNVFPSEVETHLFQHPAVRNVAVYGIPDRVTGEKVCAAVVLQAGKTTSAEELRDFCNQELASYKVPRVFRFVRDFPRNSTGKVLKQVLREQAQALLTSSVATAEEYQLVIERQGTINGIRLKPIGLAPLQKGEVRVRVRAAGLNFRDVLNVLGQYPGESSSLGFEFTGEIIEIGDGVVGFQLGDAVLGLVFGAMASSVAVPAYFVVKATGLSFVEAACIPVAFATAQLALEKVAQLRAGERVLIHSAAGGLGLAAIELARSIGAEIYVTASRTKWEYLASLGIQHIFDSRSLDFAEQINTITDGQGIDVVLNSLIGLFIEKSVNLLTPGGRFIEVGKREIRSVEEMKVQRPDISYHQVFLDDLIQCDAEAIGQMLRTAVERIRTGEWSLPRHTVIPFTEATSAFRMMERGQHIGKIILSMPEQEISLDLAQPQSEVNGIAKQIQKSVVGKRKRLVVEYLRTEIRSLLGISRNPDLQTGFIEMGMDSLVATEMVARLQLEVGNKPRLSSTLLFDYPTIEELAEFMLQVFSAETDSL
jgi:long-chain acyl-CoA synthetase